MQAKSYSFTKKKRPVNKIEVLHRRLKHAQASLAIEGLHLTSGEISVFETCIRRGYSLTERSALLKERFPGYDEAIRA